MLKYILEQCMLSWPVMQCTRYKSYTHLTIVAFATPKNTFNTY